jgi:hypothetical protein
VQPVDHVIEQLWAPALASPDLRVVVDAPAESGWTDVERYWLVPSAAKARLLVPVGPRPMVARVLVNYRKLRTRAVNASRLTLGAAARAGLPLSGSTVAVQVRTSATEAAQQLPLGRLEALLGQPLFAATGVRTSDNRKTTLHLVDAHGAPVGYAKLGWNRPTDALVANEGRVLSAVGGEPGPTRAPRVLVQDDYHGHPVIVTEPLPLDAGGSLTSVAPVTSQEMFGLTPLARQARPAETQQFVGMVSRLDDATGTSHVREVAEAALELAAAVATGRETVPVTARWHGDMTPWNRARDSSGQLWVWDWESSEDDAVAGLDPLHWAFGADRLAGRAASTTLASSLEQASAHLTAIGVPRHCRPTIASVYALTVVERACVFAAHSGTWSDAFIPPAELMNLLRQSHALLSG